MSEGCRVAGHRGAVARLHGVARFAPHHHFAKAAASTSPLADPTATSSAWTDSGRMGGKRTIGIGKERENGTARSIIREEDRRWVASMGSDQRNDWVPRVPTRISSLHQCVPRIQPRAGSSGTTIFPVLPCVRTRLEHRKSHLTPDTGSFSSMQVQPGSRGESADTDTAAEQRGSVHAGAAARVRMLLRRILRRTSPHRVHAGDGHIQQAARGCPSLLGRSRDLWRQRNDARDALGSGRRDIPVERCASGVSADAIVAFRRASLFSCRWRRARRNRLPGPMGYCWSGQRRFSAEQATLSFEEAWRRTLRWGGEYRRAGRTPASRRAVWAKH